MCKRVLLGIGFTIACLSTMSHASSVEPQKKFTIKSFAKALYTHLMAGKNCIVLATKKHPFLTVTMVIVLLSKKTRKTLWTLPKDLWQDIQEYPIAMALLGLFLLNYIIM